MRDIPIVTFVNKMDREARDILKFWDEIEQKLALDTAPMTWPIGQGKTFAGTYHLSDNTVRTNDSEKKQPRSMGQSPTVPQVYCQNMSGKSSSMNADLPWRLVIRLILKPLDPDICHRSILVRLCVILVCVISSMHLVPMRPLPDHKLPIFRTVEATDEKNVGFRLQNSSQYGPQPPGPHAFVRVCSGQLKRGMKARLARTGKQMGLTAPQFFFASQRQLADTAYAGDVVGIPNHGALRIGDTLTDGEALVFQGVPNFAPEILRRVHLEDKMKAKKLREALQQMAEEGVVQLFIPEDGSPAIIGVVGALQLDVLKERLMVEYSLPVSFEMARFTICRWISSENETDLDNFMKNRRPEIARDLDGDPVFLASDSFH